MIIRSLNYFNYSFLLVIISSCGTQNLVKNAEKYTPHKKSIIKIIQNVYVKFPLKMSRRRKDKAIQNALALVRI